MILFHTSNTLLKICNRRAIKKWISNVLKTYGKQAGDIGIIFCNSEYMLQLNKKYLNHDHYTDVITFTYSEKNSKRLSGDVFVDPETVFFNASKYEQTKEQELLRVIIHGILHMSGMNDQTPEERKCMSRAEDAALSEVTINPFK
ncbi:MAG: rRNA maturation RNase YbeY [Bacteroidales bacterium]|jgi:probable rRNA maturation factor|nr:rRNA maturation RNase YbeY [Bacteroidales bacterium]